RRRRDGGRGGELPGRRAGWQAHRGFAQMGQATAARRHRRVGPDEPPLPEGQVQRGSAAGGGGGAEEGPRDLGPKAAEEGEGARTGCRGPRRFLFWAKGDAYEGRAAASSEELPF
ncbi:unnamed protein product, partial [Effrenium voratum]